MVKIGFMQGRFSPLVNDRIQAFPVENWENEFKIAKAKKEIYMNMSSASPSNLTDRKKLIAIPTPPNGGMFKAFNLF